jgi:hypothetical protein
MAFLAELVRYVPQTVGQLKKPTVDGAVGTVSKRADERRRVQYHRAREIVDIALGTR